VIEGLAGGANVDLAVGDVIAAWRGALPSVLGHGTAQ
jgi:hypothetical protein